MIRRVAFAIRVVCESFAAAVFAFVKPDLTELTNDKPRRRGDC